MNRRIMLLGALALALFMVSSITPLSATMGTVVAGQPATLDGPALTASETGLEGRNTPLSMLVYTQYADTSVGGEFRNTLDSIEDEYGKWFNYQNLTDYTELAQRIWAYDVFLIVEQEYIQTDNVTELVSEWSPFITDWVTQGGIIVLMDFFSFAESDHGISLPLYNETGLMSIWSYTEITFDPIAFDVQGDALARGIENDGFGAPDGSLGYNVTGATKALSFGPWGWANHRVMGKGHVVLLGFDNYNRNPYADIVLANALRLHQHVIIDNSHLPGMDPYTGNVNFTNDLLDGGFAVSIMDTWYEWLVRSGDVLLLQYGSAAYSTTEIDLIEEWVLGGGGLFVLSEFGGMYGATYLDPIIERFGFERNQSALLSDSDDWEHYDRYVIYQGAGNIVNHSATLDCQRVEFAGSGGFASIPANGVPLIVADNDATAEWYFGSNLTYAGKWPGAVSAAVATSGQGRVGVILDTTIIDNSRDFNSDGLVNYFEYDNSLLAVNTVRWLFAAGIEEKIVLFEESKSPFGLVNSDLYDFAVMLTLNGFTVKWESSFYEDLISEADVLVLFDGASNHTLDEIGVISSYVANGGSLFLVGDNGPYCQQIFDIGVVFGLRYNFTAGHVEESDDYEVYTPYLAYGEDNFATHPIMEGVYRMEFDLCTAFQSIGTATALAFTDDDGTATWSATGTPAEGLALATAVNHGKGRVVAITDINMPMTSYDPEPDGYPNMLDADNDVFLSNAFLWLTANRAPVVEVAAPNGGETYSGVIQLNWTASDADDDPLTFNVYYSDDSGGSWTPIATGIGTTSISWNTTLLDDGSEYLIRVRASDGELTAQDESDGTFTIDNPEPPGITLDPMTLAIIGVAVVAVLVIVFLLAKRRSKD